MLVKDNRLECAIQHSLRTHCSIRRRLYSVPSPISFRFHYLFCIQLLSTWKKENLLLNIANSFFAVILWSSCACLAGRLAARSPRFQPCLSWLLSAKKSRPHYWGWHCKEASKQAKTRNKRIWPSRVPPSKPHAHYCGWHCKEDSKQATTGKNKFGFPGYPDQNPRSHYWGWHCTDDSKQAKPRKKGFALPGSHMTGANIAKGIVSNPKPEI